MRPIIDNTRSTRWSLSGLGIVLFVSTWYIITDTLHIVNETVLPTPIAVSGELLQLSDLLVENLRPTLQAAVVGFISALLLAVGVAVLLTASDRLRKTFMPLIIAGNSVPRVSLAPLIIFYIGSGEVANYLISAWIAFFPMLINTADGLVSIDEDLENLLDVVGATRWQEYRYVRFLNALPNIFDGMKTGVTLAVIGAIVGEFVAAEEGMGYLALFGLYNVNLSLVFSVVLVMSVITTISIFGLYLLQSRLIFWKDVDLFTES